MSAEQPDFAGRVLTPEIDFTGPKNGEECDACKSNPDDLCPYHRGYDDGWEARARLDA